MIIFLLNCFKIISQLLKSYSRGTCIVNSVTVTFHEVIFIWRVSFKLSDRNLKVFLIELFQSETITYRFSGTYCNMFSSSNENTWNTLQLVGLGINEYCTVAYIYLISFEGKEAMCGPLKESIMDKKYHYIFQMCTVFCFFLKLHTSS